MAKGRENMSTDNSKESWGSYFRPSHIIREFGYLIIIDTLIAVFLSATGIAHPFGANMVFSQCYGISIFLILHLLFRIFKPGWAVGPIILMMGVSLIFGYLVGGYCAVLILKRFFSIAITFHGAGIVQQMALALAISAAVSYFFFSKARLRVNRAMIQQERLTRLSIEKEALEAKLRLLQAQIEPHFLFNTLSNVLSLIDVDPARGKVMLSDLIHYLRTSLSRTLPAVTTLDQEMDVCATYLKIQKVRMGERLHFEVILPDELKQHPFPPMLIQPLVENALKHGLEPRVEGGTVLVETTDANGFLRITVADTGDGLSEYEQGGVGLANVRERLRLLFGDKAHLSLEENKPHGVRAVIEVPRDGL